MQEFMLRTPTHASTRGQRVEDIETARIKQMAREEMSEMMRRDDEGKIATSIWDLLGNDPKRVVGVKEGDQEQG